MANNKPPDMITSRKKKNLKVSLILWGAGLLILGACLWLELYNEAIIIGVLLLLNTVPMFIGWLLHLLRNNGSTDASHHKS